MPLPYVRALNARFKGTEASASYDTFIVQTRGNEDVSRLVGAVEKWGFGLSRKSEDARKAGDLLFILTIVFSFISLVILFVAGVNIAHTFLTLVTERRHEIGIMRAIGASRADIRRLFLTEAFMLGLFGGLLGNALSYGATRLANWAGQTYLADIPFKPDDFFVYDWRVIAGGIAFACVFCLLGALFPARRASRLDPAVVLTS
jgi:ABC-type antimicrobial peptide transport system permease subunit